MASWLDNLLDSPWLSDGRAQALAAMGLLLLAGELVRHEQRVGSRIEPPPPFPAERRGFGTIRDLQILPPWNPTSDVLSAHPGSQVQVWVAPRDFLAACSATGDGDDRSWRSEAAVDWYRERLFGRGKPVDVLQLDLALQDGGIAVTGHEGRHRATAALRLGLPAVPVVFFWQAEHGHPATIEVEAGRMDGPERERAIRMIQRGAVDVRPQWAASRGSLVHLVLRTRDGRWIGHSRD